MDTPDLFKRIQNGDELAFERLFRLFYERLCNYALAMLNDRDEAEEVVQDIFVSIWQKRESLVITTGIKPYLYRAVYNRCINSIRHEQVKQQHKAVQLAAAEQYAQPARHLEQKELQDRISDALSHLPPECGRIFRLSRHEQLTYKEIADLLEISVKTVENQMGKALRILRSELADYLPVLAVLFLLLKEIISPVGVFFVLPVLFQLP